MLRVKTAVDASMSRNEKRVTPDVSPNYGNMNNDLEPIPDPFQFSTVPYGARRHAKACGKQPRRSLVQPVTRDNRGLGGPEFLL